MEKFQKRSISQRWDELQPTKAVLVWACVGSVAATLIIGFSWGGWVTGGTAKTMAANASEGARGELASVICVEEFMSGPDAAVQLAALKELSSSYRQRQFVEEGGWATMPGTDSATRQAADLCAKELANREIGQTASAAAPIAQ